MVAEARALAGVQAHDEQAAVLQHPQDLGGIGAVQQAVAEVGLHLLQDAGAQQELLHRRGLLVQHLVGQVGVQVLLAAVGHQLAQQSLPDGVGGETDAGDPALGLAGQALDLRLGQMQVEALLEELAHLVGGEAQLVHAQTGDVALGSQEAEGLGSQGGDGAADQDQANAGGKPLQQGGHEAAHQRTLIHQVVVVHHDVEGVGQGAEVGGQALGQDSRVGIAAIGLEEAVGDLAGGGEGLPDGGQQVLDEAAQVAVVLVGAEPGHRRGRRPGEIHQQRGLAVAGGRRKQQEALVGLGQQEVQQPLPAKQRRRPARQQDLGGKDVHRLVCFLSAAVVASSPGSPVAAPASVNGSARRANPSCPPVPVTGRVAP